MASEKMIKLQAKEYFIMQVGINMKVEHNYFNNINIL